MLKNSFYMFTSVALKLIGNFIIFILIARVFGTSDFGKFMYYYTISTIISLIIDYGFNLYVIKEMSQKMEDHSNIISTSFIAKLIIAISTIPFILIMYINNLLELDLSFFILYLSMVFNSFLTFFGIPHRVRNRYETESLNTIISNVVLIIFVCISFLVYKSILLLSIVFLFARLIAVIVAYKLLIKEFGRLIIKKSTLVKSLTVIKENFYYGIHLIIGTLYVQVDTLIVKQYLNFENVGIYQASMRIVSTSLILSEVFSGVYLPKISKSLKDSPTTIFIKHSRSLNKLMILSGGIVTIFISVYSDIIIKLLYGNDFGASSTLLVFATFLILFRYLSVSDGQVLTVADKQSLRALAAITGLVLNITLNMMLIPKFGLKGAVLAAIISSFILYIVYNCFTYNEFKKLLLTYKDCLSILIIVLVLIIFNSSFSINLVAKNIIFIATCLYLISQLDTGYFMKFLKRSRSKEKSL